jgi:hypothetical protein
MTNRLMLFKKIIAVCMISSFRRGVNEILALLGFYTE